MATMPNSLAGFRDLLLPGIWSANRGKRVLDADIRVDHLHDQIVLIVRHHLCSRYEMENKMYHLISDRINEALLAPKPAGKDMRVIRRQLHWRGKQAADSKPRKRT